MTTGAYDVHGVTMAVRSASLPAVEAVDRRLRSFSTDAPDLAANVVVDLVVGHPDAPRPPAGQGRPVYDAPGGQVLYYDTEDILWMDYRGSAWLRVEASKGAAHLWAGGSGEEDVWLVSHPLLTIALLELLERRGRYSLHAAAMASADGTVTLLAGGSGAGKTTLALALLRHGWAFLADDTVFLGAGEAAGPTVLGFADEVDVGDGTADLLPGLHDLLAGTSIPGREKRQLRVEDAFGTAPVMEGRPVALVFPSIGADERSRLEPIAPDEALVELAPNVLLTEPASSQAHLDALADLVRTTPCWRLKTGRDFDRLAGMLRELAPTLPAPPGAGRLVPG